MSNAGGVQGISTAGAARLLQERFDGLLESDPGLASLSTRLREKRARLAVFGGWARDTLLMTFGGHAVEPKDIDIVVAGLDAPGLRQLLPDSAAANTFGGFAVHAYRLPLDIWCIEDTYTVKKRGLPPSFDLLPSTTVFTLESIVFEPCPPWARSTVVEDSFFESLETRTIKLQGGEVLYPGYQAGRALLFEAKLRFSLAPDARALVLRALAADGGAAAAQACIQKHSTGEVRERALARLREIVDTVSPGGNEPPGI